MILESIVTTLNEDNSANVSPMGPLTDATMSQFVLRPFNTSQTYRNLKRLGEGVLHVTDDVELMARAAVGQLDPAPMLMDAESIEGKILTDACRWYEFRVIEFDERNPRTELTCEVIHHGRIRDFFGFNRAKHAVLEAAILATRLEFIPAEEVQADFARLAIIVDKTAGRQEHDAFAFLRNVVKSRGIPLEHETYK